MTSRAIMTGGVLLALLVLWGGASDRPAVAALVGDVDGDGAVTERDAYHILHLALELREPNGRERILADAWPAQGPGTSRPTSWSPGDGALNVADAVLVLQTAAGLRQPRDLGPIVYDVAGSGPSQIQVPSKFMGKNPRLAEDGPALEIYLFDPWDLALAPNGDVYFTEFYGSRIRVLKTDGTVRTLAGSFAKRGYADGRGTRALFNRPEGLALLPDGSLAVADANNNAIRRVTPGGEVSTLAGNGVPGFQDGQGREALFYEPTGVASDPEGNVFVADMFNQRIRKVAPDGTVTTVVGSGAFGFADGPALSCKLANPTGVFYDTVDGSLYLSDVSTVRRLSDGRVRLIAGGTGTGGTGFYDGYGSYSRFNAPFGMDRDSAGRLWVADFLNGLVRYVDLNDEYKSVKTAAGVMPNGRYLSGPASMARLNGLMNVRAGRNGYIYLADTDNERIRVLVP